MSTGVLAEEPLTGLAGRVDAGELVAHVAMAPSASGSSQVKSGGRRVHGLLVQRCDNPTEYGMCVNTLPFAGVSLCVDDWLTDRHTDWLPCDYLYFFNPCVLACSLCESQSKPQNFVHLAFNIRKVISPG